MFNINKIKQLIVFTGVLFIGLPIMGAAAEATRGIKRVGTVTVINKTGEVLVVSWQDSPFYRPGKREFTEPPLQKNETHVIRERREFIIFTIFKKDCREVIDLNALPDGDITLVVKLSAENKLTYEVQPTEAERKEAGQAAAAAVATPAAVSVEDRLRACQEELARVKAKLAEYELGV